MTPRASAALGAALLVLSGVLSACGAKPYVAPTPTAVATIDPGQATTTLERFQAAVRRGDADAARALGSDAAAGDRLAAVARNVRAIGLTDVALTYLTETGGGSLHGSWVATTQVSWRIKGFDPGIAQAQVDVSFADGGSRISGLGGDQDTTPLWMTGPVTVRRTADTMVIATTPPRVTDALAAEARVAIARDHAVLGPGPKVVYEAPATIDALHRALDAEDGTYSRVAAMTAPVGDDRTPRTPVHVFLNPDVFRGMGRVAAQVVMTHESVHAVTGAPLVSGPPLWLVEGFADFVALGDVHLPLSKTAGQISADVRRHGPPRALPDDAAFGPRGDDLGPTYEAAWLACVTIAEHAGEDGLVRLYRDVLGGTPIATALSQDTGLTIASLTADWRAKLTAVAAHAR